MSNGLPTVFVTGMSGLVGSTFAQHMGSKYQLVNLDLSDPVHPVDITDAAQVQALLTQYPGALGLVHCAAFTDVTAAWQQRGNRSGIAYKVNVQGTATIASICAQLGIPLVHISTAYVFDGKKSDSYTESDSLSPIEWYGETKALAEEEVHKAGGSWSILRIDQPFRKAAFFKPDLIRKSLANLTSATPYPVFEDHYIGPTYLDDLAHVIAWVLESKQQGIFHASSGEKWSDFQIAQLVAQKWRTPAPIAGSLAKYLQTINRPYQANTALNCSKLYSLYPGPHHSIKEAVEGVEI